MDRNSVTKIDIFDGVVSYIDEIPINIHKPIRPILRAIIDLNDFTQIAVAYIGLVVVSCDHNTVTQSELCTTSSNPWNPL